jgi:hypothetical protein
VPSGSPVSFLAMPLADLLFNSGDLRSALHAQAGKLVAEVQAAPQDHVLQADEDLWATALAERGSVQAPELHVDRMWQDPPQEVQVDVRGYGNRAIFDYSQPAWFPGYRVTIHIPFSGEADVFKLQPSSFTYNPPRAQVRNGELTDTIEYRTTAPSTSLRMPAG